MNLSHADLENATSELFLPLLQGKLADWAVSINAQMKALGMGPEDVQALEAFHHRLSNHEVGFEGEIDALSEKLGGNHKAAIEFWGVFGMRDAVRTLLIASLDTAERQHAADTKVPEPKPASDMRGWVKGLLKGRSKADTPEPMDQAAYFKRRSEMNAIYGNVRGMLKDFSGLGDKQIDVQIERLKQGVDAFVAEQLGPTR